MSTVGFAWRMVSSKPMLPFGPLQSCTAVIACIRQLLGPHCSVLGEQAAGADGIEAGAGVLRDMPFSCMSRTIRSVTADARGPETEYHDGLPLESAGLLR